MNVAIPTHDPGGKGASGLAGGLLDCGRLFDCQQYRYELREIWDPPGRWSSGC